MQRTTLLRALAAAGATAVLSAAASATFAAPPPKPNPPFEQDWGAELEAEGYQDVSCTVSAIPGGQEAIYFTQDWSVELAGANDWLLVVLQVPDEEEALPWRGYATQVLGEKDGVVDVEGPIYSSSTEDGITHALLCQGLADDSDDQAAEPTDETQTEDLIGPPVETDGRSPSGPDLGLIGGAALTLAGGGAAGLALRRRGGAHH